MGCDTFSSICNLLIDDTSFIACCMVSATVYALDWVNILYAGLQTVLLATSDAVERHHLFCREVKLEPVADKVS